MKSGERREKMTFDLDFSSENYLQYQITKDIECLSGEQHVFVSDKVIKESIIL